MKETKAGGGTLSVKLTSKETIKTSRINRWEVELAGVNIYVLNLYYGGRKIMSFNLTHVLCWGWDSGQ